MDDEPTTDDSEIAPLRVGRIEKTGVPREGHSERSPVEQINAQGIIRHTDFRDSLASFRF